MIGLVGCIAMRECYVYVKEKNIKRLGSHSWLLHLILALEMMLIYKFKEGKIDYIDLFTAPFPEYVVYMWIFIAFVTLSMLFVVLYRDY
jgi:hypothetical protein